MKKAFTIVELLVVMAVIGILITLAVVGIQAIQRAQREVVRQNDLRNLQGKIEEYYGKYRTYPNFDYMVVASDGTAICLLNPSAAIGSTSGANGRCNKDITQNAEFFSSLQINIPINTFGNPLGYVQYWITVPYYGALGTGTVTGDSTYGCVGTNWTGNNSITADKWVLYYSVGTTVGYGTGGTAQQYRIGECTENGAISPIGSKLD